MNLTWIDWTLILVAIVILRFISLRTRIYMKGVADFLSANRSAGRYLLTIAGQMGGFGAISMVALFEMYYTAGFPPIWWGFMSIPVGVIILLTGWVYYRFRETRALTLAQFLEMRYSKRFRIFSGIVIFASGVINFGIFPAVAARFIIYYCGLPDHFHIPGISLGIPTFPVVMAIDLGLALTFVTMGGQISVMVTDCAQGMVSAFIFVIVAITVLVKLQWPQVVQALNMAPAEASMFHPFHTSQVEDFNIWYFLIGIFGSFYAANSWQGASGFQSSGRTPHEQKMGGVIGLWRYIPLSLMVLVLPIAAYAVMHLPEFSAQATAINKSLNTIGNEAVRNQMRVPITLATFLPVGIRGLLAIVVIFFSFTCHDTYLHSWGTIFVQDVVIPIRKKLLDPEQHIRWLRRSVTGVTIFGYLFSLLYPQSLKILMFFAITGTIWLGGSGPVIVGGLYWRRGTAAAAYSALILGAVVGVGGLIVPQIYEGRYHKEFPINGQWLYMLAMLGAGVLYVIVSLLTHKKGKEFNLEKMLHRGKYRVRTDQVKHVRTSRWLQIVGITEEFSIYDRILAVGLLVWNFGWFAIFLVVTIANLFFDFPVTWWANFWHFYVWLLACIAIPATIWFTIGGVLDIKALFKTLATMARDHTDDGRVMHEPEETSEPVPDMEPEPAPVGQLESARGEA